MPCMALSRAVISEFLRVLDTASTPVYLVDVDQHLVYANAACGEWLGIELASLIGCACRYHDGADATGPLATAALLAPPPKVMSGQVERATLDAAGTKQSKEFLFLPLPAAEGAASAVLAVALETEGTHSLEVSPWGDADSPHLHRMLHLLRRESELRFHVEELLGVSAASHRVQRQVRLAAETLVSVNVVGPLGSGRQQVARTIHYAAPVPSTMPMVPLACPLLGPEMLQNAVRALVRHRTHAAGQGIPSMLLLNVDQLPSDSQAELAGLLKYAELPLRFLSTSTEKLVTLSQRGTFLVDLAYFLSSLTIELAPLSRRTEDIPLLAQRAVERLNAQGKRQISGFTPEALDQLVQYEWPGEIDELNRIVTAAYRAAQGVEITARDLPDKIRLATDAAARPRPRQDTIVLREFLQEVEKELIVRAMTRCKGNKTKAAKLLGLSRQRLYRRLIQLGLERPDQELA